MIEGRVASRYAAALFGLAEAPQQLEALENELAQAKELVRRHSEIPHLLMNATLSPKEKEDFLEKILPEGTSRLLVDFLKVLVKKRRFPLLRLIQEQFHRLYEEKKGLQRVRVSAAICLDEPIQERLRKALEKRLNRKVTLEVTQDPGLLGGLVLDFDGKRIDASFRTRLDELRQRLVEPYAEA